MKSLHLFASVHASFHSHFNTDRHLAARPRKPTGSTSAGSRKLHIIALNGVENGDLVRLPGSGWVGHGVSKFT